MIWPDEEHDSSQQLQKKLEYAKELELQIEVRRAHQREEQLELEELERKFQPDDRSPAKWLVDGGYSAPVVQHPDFASYRSPFRFPQQQQSQFQSHGVNAGQPASSPLPLLPSAGEPSGAPSVGRDDSTSSNAANSHTRFRITDLQEQSDRLRERTQQLEWKRILDEQVRENVRLKQHEDDERRRDEAGSVREEMMFLRDQQLAAQRRMGLPLVNAASHPNPTPAPAPHHYEPVGDHQESEYQRQHRNYDLMQNNDNAYEVSDPPYNRADQNYYGHQYDGANAITMPPPAPARFNYPASSPSRIIREPAPSQQVNQQQAYDSFSDSRGLIINEYRSLLAEIRREREELRQEKEELRQEKEQLRLERALLQLENEKMASYVDAQRRVNDQQLEMQRQETFRQPQQQQTASTYPSPVREYYHAPPASVQRSQRPPAFDLSQVNQMERSIAALGLGNHSVREPRAQECKPSPISMDDFAIPQNRRTPNIVDSPRFKRLSQFRLRPAAYEHEEVNALDQSLVGESVFVALSPDEVSSAASRGPPRITETASPRRSERADSSARNELRNSRVIKSRGFYNIESEANAFPARAAAEAAERRHAAERKKQKKKSSHAAQHRSPGQMPRSAEKSRVQQEKAAKRFEDYESSGRTMPFAQSSSAVDTQQKKSHHRQRQFASSSATAGHNDGGMGGSEDGEESELSRSLFQVKVLV